MPAVLYFDNNVRLVRALGMTLLVFQMGAWDSVQLLSWWLPWRKWKFVLAECRFCCSTPLKLRPRFWVTNDLKTEGTHFCRQSLKGLVAVAAAVVRALHLKQATFPTHVRCVCALSSRLMIVLSCFRQGKFPTGAWDSRKGTGRGPSRHQIIAGSCGRKGRWLGGTGTVICGTLICVMCDTRDLWFVLALI